MFQEKLDLELETILLNIEHFTEKSIKKASGHEITALIGSIVEMVIAAIFSIFTVRFVSRGISHNLDAAIGVANRIAGGDFALTIETSSRDETGDMLRALDSTKKGQRVAGRYYTHLIAID